MTRRRGRSRWSETRRRHPLLKGTPAEILVAIFELCPRQVSDQWDLKIKQRKETDKVSLVRDQTTAKNDCQKNT